MLATVFSSALWLSETWLLTKQQRLRLDSWGARITARVARVARCSEDDVGQHWRHLHRTGHQLLLNLGGGLDWRRASRLHSFAGHCARSTSGLVPVALRTRRLAWWRYRQARYPGRNDGLHPKRFKVWRWESQLSGHYGEEECRDPTNNVGWMLLAQCRDTWRQSLRGFLSSTI